MEKSILVFSNGEKIGDGLIKLPLLHEIKKRFPQHKIVWVTDTGSTVYNSILKNIASQYLDEIIETANLNPLFWKKISNKYEFENFKFNYIFDTQKAVIRTLALKRIKCLYFISASALGLFSNIKIKKNLNNKERKYYLQDLFNLLNNIKEDSIDKNFEIPIPIKLDNQLRKIFDNNYSYIGFAPGAGEENKIWPINNFIEVAKFFDKKSYKIVFFLGPNEQSIKQDLVNLFPKSIIPEDLITDYSGPEVVIGSTKYLSCALSNDSGVSHMLSNNYCPLVKLFGPKDSKKFTPEKNNIITISSSEYGSKNIDDIKIDIVLKKMNEFLN